MTDFTLEDIANAQALDAQLACVKRELALRRSCYPRWVRAGSLKQADADSELQTMEAVLHTLQALRDKLQ